jgi:glycosyltransferase involved in cell wall biosynthesis
MKIAHVVDSMEIGGAETLVAQLCRLQREDGHDPSVYAILSLGPLGEQLRKEGFQVRAHVGHSLIDSMRNFYYIFKELLPDVVHLHNPTPATYAGISARMAGVPSIISTRHSLVAPPHNFVRELKYCVAVCFCDWVVGICDATANNIKEMPGIPARKIRCVYNGAVPLARARQEQWSPKSGFTLVYVGRLEPVKNHALLLNGFREALASLPGLRLWMVGDGSERSDLEKLAAQLGITSQVTFWGQQLDVVPFFSAADAFIMSSKSEGLPISLLQAFSLGLPAIVTDVGGMAEVVRLASAGIIVSPMDAGGMAAAMVRMATRNQERAQFSSNAETAFHSRFTLRTMADAYMDLYTNTRRTRRGRTQPVQL